jgi:long-chain acyl-CoA synthetase
MLVPMLRCKHAFSLRATPRFLSYLPLSHVAERQLVWIQSLIYGGEVTFNESLATLVRDMSATRPNYFFGPPRVWEQLQLGILARFGSQEQLNAALESGGEAVAAKIREGLGLQEADYLLTAAAPTPAALIEWYHRLGIALMEGYGQTEAMGLIANNRDDFRLGSIGKTVAGVEARIDDSGELLVRAEGLAEGYYRLPEQTAETFVDGWVHTGDRARVDEDGFYYITGRVKDYFKTIQGKFVSPVPIETEFARCRWVDQQCLLGRGYSKTVMVCVLSPIASEQQRERITSDLQSLVRELNQQVDRHARIGGLIVTDRAWTIENGMLTPTLKLRRERVEASFGETAFVLARQAAEQGELLLAWDTGQRA